ncbi:ABC transporter ATP-binding protein [Oleidesulfovibrio sp.]|uniref:ABC transporter ATP-binding protein n=1 Tax=Oleidesulfovibrio sp. TaxID=2909707 RepID=UPI003A874790
MHTTPGVSLHAVDVGYENNVVLRNLTLTIPAGRITVILGGSGCGKSTLLRHILGLQRPVAGDIFIDGNNLCSMTEDQLYEYRRNMGVLFQGGALLGSLTLRENVALPLLEHSQLDDETLNTVVRLKLSLVGLDNFLDYYPSQLSGGMRKRAGLARALALDPGILLCDEPSAGLDPITAAEVDQLITDLHQSQKMTILVVTHDLDSLYRIAEHVIVLNAGEVLFNGPLEQLRQADDPYIRQFLSRTPGARKTPSWLL